MGRRGNGKWTDESRKRLSETRRVMFAEGELRGGYNKKTEIPSLDGVTLDFGYWLAGFVDGEGCFSAARRRRRAGPDGVQATFSLALREDDEDVLVEIQRVLGFGTITYFATRTTDVARYGVHSWAGCMALVQLFSDYPLRSKKRDDFTAWARIVQRGYEEYNPLFDSFSEELAQMSAIKNYNRRRAVGQE